MTYLEITKLCAEAMGFGNLAMTPFTDSQGRQRLVLENGKTYWPLHDDAQAMALVKKFGIEIHCRTDRNGWYVGIIESDGMVPHVDLNRAICECVAKMQKAKVSNAA